MSKSTPGASAVIEVLRIVERAFLTDAKPPYTIGDSRFYVLEGGVVGSALERVRLVLGDASLRRPIALAELPPEVAAKFTKDPKS